MLTTKTFNSLRFLYFLPLIGFEVHFTKAIENFPELNLSCGKLIQETNRSIS